MTRGCEGIRALVEDDWEDLKAVRLAALEESPDAFGQPHHEAARLDDAAWRSLAAGREPPTFLLAYDSKGRPCGLIGGVAGEAEYHLISMWVAPEARGSHIAGDLVEALVEHTRGLGYDEVFLWVAQNNPRACQFYLKHGFVTLGASRPLRSNPAILTRKMGRKITETDLTRA